jgi:hypothetical protein
MFSVGWSAIQTIDRMGASTTAAISHGGQDPKSGRRRGEDAAS